MKINFYYSKIFWLFSIILSIIYLFSLDNFYYNMFGDRDLSRAQNLIDEFQYFGTELNHKDGLRNPGGALYYYLFILQTVFSNNIEILYYISSIINLFSIFFFCYSSYVLYSDTRISLLTFLLISTNITFIDFFFRFWNPTMGFFLLITSYSFFFIYIKNLKIKYLYLAFICSQIAGQFHLTYLIPSFFYFFYIICFINKKKIKYLFFFLFITLFLYSPAIFNLYLKDKNFFVSQSLMVFESDVEVSPENKNRVKSNKNIEIDSIISAKALKNIKQEFSEKFLSIFRLVSAFDSGIQIINIPIIFIFSFLFYFFVKKKIISSFKIIIIYFILSLFFFYLAYLYSYNLHVIGPSGRYIIFIIPIFALIFSHILIFLIDRYKKKYLFFFICSFLLIKIIASYFFIKEDKYTSLFSKYNEKKIIEDFLFAKNLSQENILSKVNLLNTNNFVLDYQIKNSSNKKILKEKINLSAENDSFCYSIIWTGDKNFNLNEKKESIYNLNFFADAEIYEIEKFSKYIFVTYKTEISCPNNFSNDYILNNEEKFTEKILLDLPANQIYKEKKTPSIVELTNEIKGDDINYYVKISPYLNNLNSVPLNIKIKINKKDNSLSILSKQLRSNTVLGGYFGGYTIKNLKLQFVDNNFLVLKEYIFNDINLGQINSKFKSPISLNLKDYPKQKVTGLNLILDIIDNTNPEYIFISKLYIKNL